MLVTLVLVLLQAIVLIALVVSGPLATKVGSAIGVGDTAVTAWNIAKWPVLLLVVVLTFCVLYYASPNARLSGLKSVVPGALLALAIWLIASVGFAAYVANFDSYNKTYGALAGVVVLLVWLDHQPRRPARRGVQRGARTQPPDQSRHAGCRARTPTRRTLQAQAEEALTHRMIR